MADQGIGSELLKLDLGLTSGVPDPKVEQIIENDRRRVRWLTWATIALWVLAGVGVLLMYVIGGLVFPQIAHALEASGEAKLNQADSPILMLAKLTALHMMVGTLSFALLAAAGLATVLLLFRSRRATLRQINANLLAISRQLHDQQKRPGDTGAAGPNPSK